MDTPPPRPIRFATLIELLSRAQPLNDMLLPRPRKANILTPSPYLAHLRIDSAEAIFILDRTLIEPIPLLAPLPRLLIEREEPNLKESRMEHLSDSFALPRTDVVDPNVSLLKNIPSKFYLIYPQKITFLFAFFQKIAKMLFFQFFIHI